MIDRGNLRHKPPAGNAQKRNAWLRSLHDVANAFSVGVDAHIDPRAGKMLFPASHIHKKNCHCEGAKRLRQSVSRLPARSALQPAAEVSTGHPRPGSVLNVFREADCFAVLAMTPFFFVRFRFCLRCFSFLQRLRLCRAVMPAPTISPEMRRGGTHVCVPYIRGYNQVESVIAMTNKGTFSYPAKFREGRKNSRTRSGTAAVNTRCRDYANRSLKKM